MHPFVRSLQAPLHISHRGGAALYPENTMYAFERALRLHRTDMLELDVQATRDGEVVVAHDATLERCTDGTGPLEALDYAALARLDAAFHFCPVGGRGTPLRGMGLRIPRLKELLEAFPELRLNVEVKSRAALEPFVALCRASPEALERLCIGSEDDALSAALVEALPDACHFFPANALAAFVMSARSDALDDDPRYSVLDMPLVWEGLPVFDETIARVAAGARKWVNVWTVDAPEAMRSAIRDRVGGVMTDRPDLLRAVLDER